MLVPLGLTLPFSVAPVLVMAVAASVVATGGMVESRKRSSRDSTLRRTPDAGLRCGAQRRSCRSRSRSWRMSNLRASCGTSLCTSSPRELVRDHEKSHSPPRRPSAWARPARWVLCSAAGTHRPPYSESGEVPRARTRRDGGDDVGGLLPSRRSSRLGGYCCLSFTANNSAASAWMAASSTTYGLSASWWASDHRTARSWNWRARVLSPSWWWLIARK